MIIAHGCHGNRSHLSVDVARDPVVLLVGQPRFDLLQSGHQLRVLVEAHTLSSVPVL